MQDQAEIKRLAQLLETERRAARMVGDAHKRDVAELLERRAEVARLRLGWDAAIVFGEQAAAENERLRTEQQDWADTFALNMKVIGEDNHRLRAALEALTDYIAGEMTFTMQANGWTADDEKLANLIMA